MPTPTPTLPTTSITLVTVFNPPICSEEAMTTTPSTTPKQFVCRFCPQALTSSSNRLRHERRQHKQETAEWHKQQVSSNCLFCNKAFTTLSALQAHAQVCRSPPPLPPSITPTTVLPPSPYLAIDEEEEEEEMEEPEQGISDSKQHECPLPLMDVDGISSGFLQWLGVGPVTAIENIIKSKRMTTEKQLAPARSNLRFMLNTVSVIQGRNVTTLMALVQVGAIQGLMNNLQQKQRGPARVYALSLLLKKIAVYLCSRQSIQSSVYISPTTLPAWELLDNLCIQSTKTRKCRQRDKLVLSPPSMTTQDLATIVQGCLRELDSVMTFVNSQVEDGAFVGLPKATARNFTDCLITVCFALLLAPRQQVFRNLTTETLVSPFNTEAGNPHPTYLIRMSAELSKVGQPVLLRVPEVLTGKWAFYLEHILPFGHRGSIFLQRGGVGRQDFSTATTAVTQQLIGRPINAHQFRHCIATLFHGREDTSDSMMRQLATVMNHDPQTQMSHYVHQHRLEAQDRLHGVLMEEMLG